MSETYELITADLDGTLVDTAAEIADAANRALSSFGMPRRPVEEITQFIGFGTRELVLKLWTLSITEHPQRGERVQKQDVLACMDEQYARVAGTGAVPYAGCHELLTAIKAARLPLACVTNKELRHARRVLEVTGLEGYFDLVIGGDSLAERKPHASVLRHVASSLNADITRTAHLGDSSIDVAAARNAGAQAWAVSYGYNGGVPIARAQPDHLFSSLFEVRQFLFADSSKVGVETS